MKKKVLIVYASKYGATEEIAVYIGGFLERPGIEVDIKNIEMIDNIYKYDSIIIGSAVYMGQWRKKALNFLKKHELELSEKVTWIFSSGPTGKGNPEKLLNGWKLPNAVVNTINRIKPVDIKVFHGAVDIRELNFIERIIVKYGNAPIGDYRDWKDVKRWANQIGKTLLEK